MCCITGVSIWMVCWLFEDRERVVGSKCGDWGTLWRFVHSFRKSTSELDAIQLTVARDCIISFRTFKFRSSMGDGLIFRKPLSKQRTNTDDQAALGSVVFSYIYAYLSEAIATTSSTPAQCYGSECFSGTLGIAAGCCVVSGLGFAWIGRRWKV